MGALCSSKVRRLLRRNLPHPATTTQLSVFDSSPTVCTRPSLLFGMVTNPVNRHFSAHREGAED
jgi:hypothetical protein